MFCKDVLRRVKPYYVKMKYGKRLEMQCNQHYFYLDTNFFIGKNAFLSIGKATFKNNVHLQCHSGELRIGNEVGFSRNCSVSCMYRITIGNRCQFGPNVCIYDNDHVYTGCGVLPNDFKYSEIVIEEGCWIGAGSIILRGTHIGKNSVVEAGTVVKGNIPPNSLVAQVRETRIIPTTLFLGKPMDDRKTV